MLTSIYLYYNKLQQLWETNEIQYLDKYQFAKISSYCSLLCTSKGLIYVSLEKIRGYTGVLYESNKLAFWCSVLSEVAFVRKYCIIRIWENWLNHC